MPQFETVRYTAHSSDEMFALVADAERYPEFLPLCEALTIRSRRERDSRIMLVADMTVGYKAIRETFSTQVLLNPEKKAIDVKYLEGPFKYLTNRWAFMPVEPKGCEVHFHIDYEFKNRLLAMVMGTMFDRAFRMFADAFEKRADAIYGPSS